MSNEMAVIDAGMPSGVSLRDPDVILKEAGERAQALTKMVEKTQSYTQIGKKKHLNVEAWVTVGQFYGCSARIVGTEPVDYGGVMGFKARAQVTHDQTGSVLTEAESLCMHDEDNWQQKPLHQIMSMAQTRAISKALAMKFRWVVMLGGFAPTPAEEMGGHENGAKDQKPQSQPRPSWDVPRMPPYAEKWANKPISEVPAETLKKFLLGIAGSLTDPAKANFRARNEQTCLAMVERLKALEPSCFEEITSVDLSNRAELAESLTELHCVEAHAWGVKETISEADWKALEIVFTQRKAVLTPKKK